MDRRRFLRWAAAGASGGLLGAAGCGQGRAQGAPAGLYQRIWDADQASRGVPALRAEARGDRAIGFVRVDERRAGDPGHRLFAEAVIPEAKRASYAVCRDLFDNYRLDQTKPEANTADEARELLKLLELITDAAPIVEARGHIEAGLGERLSRDAWQGVLFDVWFRAFDDGRNLDLTGFEHVVIGEQKAGAVSGHHFWYKYYLEDWGLLGAGDDAIDWAGTRYDGASGREGPLTAAGRQVPEVVTLAYRWRAHDYEAGVDRELFQRIGGFFVGCSIEGLIALGTARFFDRGHREMMLNGARYRIELYRSPDQRSLRTFFPRFLGPA